VELGRIQFEPGRYLRPIALDAVLVHHLVTQSLKLADIPAAGRRITLRSNANLSTGGVCTDVTAVCHPQVRALAELLAKTSGLTTVGIDYLTTDISTAPAEAGGAFIEMNTTPGLDACVAAGWSEAAIARMVLGESVGRIPVDLTVLSAAGLGALRSGGVTPLLAEDEALIIVDALHVGQMTLRMGTAEPWAAVNAGLRNPGVAALHVICSAEDLDRFGCPVDRFRRVKIAVAEGRAIISPGWCEVLSRQGQPAVVYEPEQNILHRLTSPEPDPMRGAW
jgi:cyanophycin synthetase